MFPIFAVEGTSHMSFMSGVAPSHVKEYDLKPAIEDYQAHSIFAAEIVKFISSILNG